MSESPARRAPAEDTQATAERRRAARALLRTPLLTADGPGADNLLLVRRHREAFERPRRLDQGAG